MIVKLFSWWKVTKYWQKVSIPIAVEQITQNSSLRQWSCLFCSQVCNFDGAWWGHCVPSTWHQVGWRNRIGRVKSRSIWRGTHVLAVDAGCGLGPPCGPATWLLVSQRWVSQKRARFKLLCPKLGSHTSFLQVLKVVTKHHPGPRRKLDSTSLGWQVLQECRNWNINVASFGKDNLLQEILSLLMFSAPHICRENMESLSCPVE